MPKDKYDYMESANEREIRRQQDDMRNKLSPLDPNNPNDRVKHNNGGSGKSGK